MVVTPCPRRGLRANRVPGRLPVGNGYARRPHPGGDQQNHRHRSPAAPGPGLARRSLHILPPSTAIITGGMPRAQPVAVDDRAAANDDLVHDGSLASRYTRQHATHPGLARYATPSKGWACAMICGVGRRTFGRERVCRQRTFSRGRAISWLAHRRDYERGLPRFSLAGARPVHNLGARLFRTRWRAATNRPGSVARR